MYSKWDSHSVSLSKKQGLKRVSWKYGIYVDDVLYLHCTCNKQNHRNQSVHINIACTLLLISFSIQNKSRNFLIHNSIPYFIPYFTQTPNWNSQFTLASLHNEVPYNPFHADCLYRRRYPHQFFSKALPPQVQRRHQPRAQQPLCFRIPHGRRPQRCRPDKGCK